MLLWAMIFRVDFCHQAKDEEDGDNNEGHNVQQALLANPMIRQDWSDEGNGCKCCSFRSIEVEGRQKFVAVVRKSPISSNYSNQNKVPCISALVSSGN